MALWHDTQAASEACEHCGTEYPVRRGSLYRDDVPIALYLAGMHRCDLEGHRIVALCLALPPPTRAGAPQAVTLQVWASEDEFQMVFIDRAQSPWRDHAYLGNMLSADEARTSPKRATFLELADYLLADDPSLREYLEDDDEAS